MDIIDYAMQMELDGRDFYARAAANSRLPEIKEIFLTLADEEKRHYLFFKRLREDAASAGRELDAQPAAMLAARNIFRQLAESKSAPVDQEARAVWSEALRIEEKAEKMYRDQAARETDDNRRAFLDRIADEEKTHVYFIANMLAFLADPQGFAQSHNYQSFMSWEGR